jgi:hypothetical protein
MYWRTIRLRHICKRIRFVRHVWLNVPIQTAWRTRASHTAWSTKLLGK